MLLVCCFCDKVRDTTQPHSPWQDLQVSMGSLNRKRERTILSYTCCTDCLQDHPHAIAFRTKAGPVKRIHAQRWRTIAIDSSLILVFPSGPDSSRAGRDHDDVTR